MGRTCVICETDIDHKSSTAKYCSRRCYQKSPAAKRTKARYAKSPKGKATMHRYHQSEKGIAARQRNRKSCDDTRLKAADAIREAGITYSQLDRWATSGLVVPEKPAEGSGTRRRFSERDIAMLKIVKWLADIGITPATIRRIAKAIREAEEIRGYLLIGPDDVRIERQKARAVQLISSQTMMVELPTI